MKHEVGELGASTVTPVTATSPTVIVGYTAIAFDAVRPVPVVELGAKLENEADVENVKAENGVSTRDELMLTKVGRTVSGPTKDADTLEEAVAFQYGTESVAEDRLVGVVRG